MLCQQNRCLHFLNEMTPVILTGIIFLGLAVVLKTPWASGLYREIRSYFLTPGTMPILNIPLITALLFTMAGGTLIGLGVPRLWVSSLAGAIFGITVGTLVGLVASTMGASIVYFAGRLFLSNWIQKKFKHRIEHWKTRFQKNGFLWILYIRLFPLSNSTVVGLLSGSCRVPFVPYLAGSFLGFIPLTLLMCSLGDGSAQGKYLQIGLGIACIAAIHTLMFINKKIRLRHTGTYQQPLKDQMP